jgi:hypothetical protein
LRDLFLTDGVPAGKRVGRQTDCEIDI